MVAPVPVIYNDYASWSSVFGVFALSRADLEDGKTLSLRWMYMHLTDALKRYTSRRVHARRNCRSPV